MSIVQQALKALHVSGDLTPWIPSRARSGAKRRLYLTKEALRDLVDPGSAINRLAWNSAITQGRVAANLDLWVLGGRVYLNKKRRFMCRLKPPPPEIWELRVTEPQPQVRLFGRFLEPDTFIVTKLHSRHELGDKGSRAWDTAMWQCARAWATLFPTMPPFSATTIHDYITEKCDDYGPDCHPPERSSSRRIRHRKNKK